MEDGYLIHLVPVNAEADTVKPAHAIIHPHLVVEEAALMVTENLAQWTATSVNVGTVDVITSVLMNIMVTDANVTMAT